ncbi:hypothetical protein [Deinococcus sp.]|uniref:Agd3-related carbohydrate-binding protein n=1 Tax=Deinococcus sp. TaxID=47478 RepID=UPI0025BC5380|nr:hypothetical protein [Deinococcus sp.]
MKRPAHLLVFLLLWLTAALGQGTSAAPAAALLPALTPGATLQPDKVMLKVLVLSSGAGDFGLSSARSMLQQSGIPFDILDASSHPLTGGDLVRQDGVGRYQGVILTSSALLTVADAPGEQRSALTGAQWASLFEYERVFRVRQLALFGWPGAVPEEYGLRAVAGAAVSQTTMRATPAGQALLALTAQPVPVIYAPSYPASVTADSPSGKGQHVVPLLTDANGLVLAATSTAPDGRERLLLTMTQAPPLLHTQLLGYGLLEWLTRGVHLGEYRRFLQVDIDDWFLTGKVASKSRGGAASGTPGPGAGFRLNGSEALGVRDQQQALQHDFPLARQFRYAVAFNGGGAQPSAPALCTREQLAGAADSLSSASRCLARTFDWVNHTRDHLRMDVLDQATATRQLAENFALGAQLGLNFNEHSVVTGEQSGLGYLDPNDDGTHDAGAPTGTKQDLGLRRSNTGLLSAAQQLGVLYLASNHSVASQWDPACPTCGVVHPLNPALFLVPRWPNGLAYFVTTAQEEVAYYNGVYGPGGSAPHWNHDLSYDEVLAQESSLALGHLLAGQAFPHYMHQPNLHEYAPGRSLATDWVRALLERYSTYSTLPLTTLRWDDLGRYLERRTRTLHAQDDATLSGLYDRRKNSVLLTASRPGPAPSLGGQAGNRALPYLLTGGVAGEVYGPATLTPLRLQSGDVQGQVSVNVVSR